MSHDETCARLVGGFHRRRLGDRGEAGCGTGHCRARVRGRSGDGNEFP